MSEESLRLRPGIYRVLSAGFAPPSPAFLEVAADATTVLEELGLYDYSYGPMVADMLNEFGAADAEELSRSYEQLFETGIAGEVCHPRESIRLGNARTGETAVLGRVGSAEDIAAATVMLCGSDTITGQTIVVDGGMPTAMNFG